MLAWDGPKPLLLERSWLVDVKQIGWKKLWRSFAGFLNAPVGFTTRWPLLAYLVRFCLLDKRGSTSSFVKVRRNLTDDYKLSLSTIGLFKSVDLMGQLGRFESPLCLAAGNSSIATRILYKASRSGNRAGQFSWYPTFRMNRTFY